MFISMKNLMYCAALALMLPACKQDKSAAATDPSTTKGTELKATPPATAKPEIELFMVNVDNLLLRDQPTKNGSKVITKLGKGDFVEGNGEVSSTREEATLRGINFMEPYCRVITTTPEQHKGWAYAGGLTKVYLGTRANSPDLGRLSLFAMHLKKLNPEQPASGKAAWDYVEANFKDAKGALAEAVYVLLQDFLQSIAFNENTYKITDNIKWADDDYSAISANTFNMKKYPATAALATQGFTLETGEGMVFPIVDWQRMYQYFSSKVTPVFKQYLDLEKTESQDPGTSDGHWTISMDELAARSVRWEKFNTENPYFLYSYETQESEKWGRFALINGNDGYSFFDYETQMATDEAKTFWAKVQQQYPGTKLAADIKKMTDLLQVEGWKKTQKVDDYLTKAAEAYSGY
jgi:hypothetical protein